MSQGDQMKLLHTSLQAWIETTALNSLCSTAVTSSERSISFAHLREAARWLACRLGQRGACADKLVGLYVHRSVEMIVGMVGVLYAGAAYLPLDTRLSAQDLRARVHAAQPIAAVVTRALLESFEDVFGESLLREVIAADDARGKLDEEQTRTVPAEGAPEHAAYALFTSGSTGTPKCVVQRHKTVLHLFSVDRDKYGYREADCWLLVNPLIFDISVSDIFNALTTGGELLVPSEGELSDDRPIEQRQITKWLRANAFSVTSMTPSNFRRLLLPALHDSAPPLARLRLISFSGEGINVEDVSSVLARFPTLELINKYGLTEVQDVTYHKYSLSEEQLPGCVGRALAGCPLYIVEPDESTLKLVEPGHVGEIAVGGPQVANGYLGEPELTRAKFVADTFCGQGCVFRTGDAGRWAADGQTLICLGRMVDQHRVQGRLVDVQAAETALRAAAVAQDVALVACNQQSGSERRLVAFFLSSQEDATSADTIEAALRERADTLLLPHARPEAYRAVTSFPLTSSGKIHRHALQQLLLPEPQDASWVHQMDLLLRREVGALVKRVPPAERKTMAAACSSARSALLAELAAQPTRSSSDDVVALFHSRMHRQMAIGGSAPVEADAAPTAAETPKTKEDAVATARDTKVAKAPEATKAAPNVAKAPKVATKGTVTPATGRPEQGNLMASALNELTTYAALNGLMQHETGSARPVHVPMALLPSPFPRCEFERGRDFLCPAILELYDAAARDHAWLRGALEGAALDEAARGDEPRLRRMLDMLPISRQPLMLGIVRTDFMLDEGAGLKQIETNTISAAFSQVAPAIQRLHARLVAREKLLGEVPLMCSDSGVVDALAAAHRLAGVPGAVLFVVLEQEHLLCENLMEQRLYERWGITVETLTLQGCVERLSLGAPQATPIVSCPTQSEPPPALLLDGETIITVVYFRGGITPSCFGTSERWAARELIERSSAIKCPSAGWWLAGTKVAQASLATADAIERFLPSLDAALRAELLSKLTRMRPVGDAEAELRSRERPSETILKKEPLGVWVDADMIDKLDDFRKRGMGARDHFMMDKVLPKPVEDVTFVREGHVLATGRGVQEIGFYGVFLGNGQQKELASCVGYLVRTKPEMEADGGVCKGVAVLDSLLLSGTDDATNGHTQPLPPRLLAQQASPSKSKATGDSEPLKKEDVLQSSMATKSNDPEFEKLSGTSVPPRAPQLKLPPKRVNAWTEWGTLREVVVGNADNANFPPSQPALRPCINEEGGSCTLQANGEVVESKGTGVEIAREVGWPLGRKKQATIDAANWQLDNLANILRQRGVRVHRPGSAVDWSGSITTPFFESPNQYCATCPRDIVATVGNIVLEASQSRRDRYFEVFQFRQMIRQMWRDDRSMLWKAAPKPSFGDDMYDPTWWELSLEERYANMHNYQFCITNEEPIFDAADMMRCGKDVFVQLSMTANAAGIEWLARELAPHGIRVHTVRFPYDLAPSHLDCTFVPLRPGLVLTNPERPILEEDAAAFREAGWRFIDAPQPVNPIRPWASQSSKWLSMNVLSISPTCVVAEEQETTLHALLESEGFEVIKVPFRAVYEFGGGLHCATWDIARDDACDDFFPRAAQAASLHPASRFDAPV